MTSIEKSIPMVTDVEIMRLHYAKTCRAWLENLDRASDNIVLLFNDESISAAARRQLARWRMFVMACEELFAFNGGNEWFVSHTLLNLG